MKYNPASLNKQLLLIAKGTSLELYHASTGTLINQITEKGNSVLNIDYNNDGQRFVSVGTDCNVREYDQATKQLVNQMYNGDDIDCAGHNNNVYAIKYHPNDSNVILSSGWDGTVQFWDTRVGHSVRSIFGTYVCGDGLDIHDNSILTTSWREKDSVQIWDYRSSQLTQTLQFDQPTQGTCRPYTGILGRHSLTNYIVVGGSGMLPLIRLYWRETGECLCTWVAGSDVYKVAENGVGREPTLGVLCKYGVYFSNVIK